MRHVVWTLGLILWFVSPAWAVDISRWCVLGWDANSETDLAWYRVHTSQTSGSYVACSAAPTNVQGCYHVAAGTVQATCQQLGLLAVGQYYARLTALDATGNESASSSELSLQLTEHFQPTNPPVFNPPIFGR